MVEKLTDYDPAHALVDDDEIAAFLADALETGDAAFIAKSLGDRGAREGHGSDRATRRPVSRRALSLVQRQRKPDLEDDVGRDEGSRRRSHREGA